MIQILRRALQAYMRWPFWLRLLILLLWAGLIWALSSRPGSPKPGGYFYSFIMNGGHLGIFGIFASLVFLLLPVTWRHPRHRLLVSVLAALAYGLVDEWHQGGVKGRDMDHWDVVTDTLGAAICACLLISILTPVAWARWAILALLPLALGSVLMATG